jgi:alpha-1,2-mannosyltransferase
MRAARDGGVTIKTAICRRLQPLQSRTPAFVAALALFAVVIAPVVAVKVDMGRLPVDLAVYREAGRAVLHGIDPYAPAFGRRLSPPLPFTYPPFAAVLALPLGLLPARVLVVTWTCSSLLLLLAMVWLVLRPHLDLEQAGLRDGSLLGLAAGVVAWTVPLWNTISYGQVNVFIAFACLADCLAPPKRRGLLVGLVTAVKLTPGLFILYFAVTRQRTAAIRAALTAIACGFVAALLLPSSSREYWLHLFFDTRRVAVGRLEFFTNQSLYGMVERLDLPVWTWILLALTAAGVGLWRASRAHRFGNEVAAVALVGLTALLISPISWQHHAVWIVPALAVLAGNATGPRGVALALGALALFVVPLPYLGHGMPHEGIVGALAFVLENGYVLGYVALLTWLPVDGNPGALDGSPVGAAAFWREGSRPPAGSRPQRVEEIQGADRRRRRPRPAGRT